MLTLERRKQAETEIVRASIEAVLKHGWTLSHVDNGEDELPAEGEASKITVTAAVAQAFECDEARIYFRKGRVRAWLYIVLGNEGWTVISDYTTNLDDAIKSTEALVSKWEEEDAR